MKTTWIVVADASRARILSSKGRSSPLHDVEQLVHGESRLRDTSRNSDRPGRSFDSHGEGRHAMEPRVDQAEQEGIRFAGDIATRLSQGRSENAFDDLILVAPPHFLGLVRKALDDATSKLVREELHKEFSQLSDEDIRMRLADYI